MMLDTRFASDPTAALQNIETCITRLEMQEHIPIRFALARLFAYAASEHPELSLAALTVVANRQQLKTVKLALLLASPVDDQLDQWCREFAGMTFMQEWNHTIKINDIQRLINHDNRLVITAPQAHRAAKTSHEMYLALKSLSLKELEHLDIQRFCATILMESRNKYRTDQ